MNSINDPTKHGISNPADEHEPVSDCCGTEIIHTDICSKCKEHCEPFNPEN